VPEVRAVHRAVPVAVALLHHAGLDGLLGDVEDVLPGELAAEDPLGQRRDLVVAPAELAQQLLVVVEGPRLGVKRGRPDLTLAGTYGPQGVGDVVEGVVLLDVPVARREVARVGPGADVDVRGADEGGGPAGLEPEWAAPAVVVPAHRLEVSLYCHAVV